MMSRMRDVTEPTQLFEALLHLDPNTPEMPDVDSWWQTHLELTRGTSPAAAAVLGGFAADRLAYAFASGYMAALDQLLGAEVPRRRSLCATEARGAQPSQLECRLDLDDAGGGRLSGEKSFATMGHLADELLIVATTGRDEQGRNQLRVARIPADREGILYGEPVSPTFVPELPHAPVSLRDVRVEPDELLPGDGYLTVLKPFRTIEDAHVFLAVLGYLTKLARQVGCPPELVERGSMLISALLPVAASPRPLSGAVHRVLGGCIAASRWHITALEGSPAWAELPETTRSRWLRDRRLLEVAGTVRNRRLEVARSNATR
jgi:acyl-CoA dehydrogenase